MKNRQLFSSSLSAILTMIGVSVGLGNVWRFPYMMGKYGGMAFLLLYLLFSLVFAIPALMGEWALGRASRKGPIGAFTYALGPVMGRIIGYVLLATVLIANSYYLLVIAYVAFSTWFSAIWGFSEDQIPRFESLFENGILQYGIALGLLGFSLLVIYRGLNKGIEPISKIVVPFFLLVMAYLVFHAFGLEGATAQFARFLRPDFSAMGPSDIFAALGQAFFSLGLGGTFLLVYGSYLQPEASIPKAAIWTGAGDTGAAVLASLFIVPSILVFGLDMNSGPGLIFSTLPRLFGSMAGGQLIGTLFLLALLLVAFLSNIAALEVLASIIHDGLIPGIKRSYVIIAIGILEALLIFPTAINPDLIGVLDMVFGSGMQVLGSGLALIGLTWGLGKATTLKQLFGDKSGKWGSVLYLWIRWVIPATLLVILIGYIYGMF